MTKILGNRPVAQGDVMLVPVDAMPTDVKPAEAQNGVYVVAHSETGHNHVIEKQRAEVFESASDDFVAYIRTLGEGADLVHKRDFDTHETITIGPNRIVKIFRQREATPEGFRPAQD